MPTTPEGKLISSQNSLRHGCCSEKILIKGEKEEKLYALRDGWLADYDPQTEAALTLVLEAVKEYWFLLRNERYYNKTVYSLPEDLTEWSDEQHKSVERATRYHTAAQRRFHRAFNDLQSFYKSRKPPKSGTGSEFLDRNAPENKPNSQPEIRSLSPVLTSPAPKQHFTGKNAKKNQREIPILDQWVEITLDEHGTTVTTLYPSNEDLIKEGHAMYPPPELVYRRLNFVDGVPPEYEWATQSPERRANGGMAVQRMSVETWFETIQREKENAAGHLGRCGTPLPRPPERGGCECPTCTSLSAEASPPDS